MGHCGNGDKLTDRYPIAYARYQSTDGTDAEDSSTTVSPPAPFQTLATTCNPTSNLFIIQRIQLALVHLVHTGVIWWLSYLRFNKVQPELPVHPSTAAATVIGPVLPSMTTRRIMASRRTSESK